MAHVDNAVAVGVVDVVDALLDGEVLVDELLLVVTQCSARSRGRRLSR